MKKLRHIIDEFLSQFLYLSVAYSQAFIFIRGVLCVSNKSGEKSKSYQGELRKAVLINNEHCKKYSTRTRRNRACALP